jgi:hypothetical protein
MSSPTPTTIDNLPTLTINALNTANSIDAAQDYLPIYQHSSTSTLGINRNTFLNLSSQPTGNTDTQTLTNKTLTSPTINGATLSGTLSGTYTIGGTPTFPSSVTQNTATQTLTNKTLTSPTINSPTISNATISADTVSGYSSSTSGTIYGMSVSSGVLASAAIAGQVNTAALQNASVTPSKLSTGAAAAVVATDETTTSTTYAFLATTTDQVTVTIGANGLALVCMSVGLYNSGSNDSLASVDISGANTIAATDNRAIRQATAAAMGWGGIFLLTGLTAGSTTFKLKYRVSGGTGSFFNRNIAVIPL